MNRHNKRFETLIGSYAFEKIKIIIYDNKNDEYHKIDMLPEVYEELKRAIKEYEIDKERDLQRRIKEWDFQ